jgi:hypothetical protein
MAINISGARIGDESELIELAMHTTRFLGWVASTRSSASSRRTQPVDGKARHMRLRSWGRAVVLGVLALVLSGCTTATHSSRTETRSVSGVGENKFCSWSLDKGPSGKVHEIEITKDPKGVCRVERSRDAIYIGDAPDNVAKVLDSVVEFEFLTKGSCRRCYLNSFGGMTCVVYPGC